MMFFVQILVLVGVIYLIISIVKGLIRNAANMPTWKGIIISSLFGALPFYLFLCFIGTMGEPKSIYPNDTQTQTEADDEKKRHTNSSQKKALGCLKCILLALLALFMFSFFISFFSASEKRPNSIETTLLDTTETAEKKDTPEPAVKKKVSVRKNATKPKVYNSEIEQTEDENEKCLKNEHPVQTTLNITSSEITSPTNDKKTKSTIELLEEQNHANVVEQARKKGVSTEGSTIEILERINRKKLEKLLK